MTDNSGGRECEEEKAGPAVARVSPVTQTTAPATSPGGTKLSPPPSYKVNTSPSVFVIAKRFSMCMYVNVLFMVWFGFFLLSPIHGHLLMKTIYLYIFSFYCSGCSLWVWSPIRGGGHVWGRGWGAGDLGQENRVPPCCGGLCSRPWQCLEVSLCLLCQWRRLDNETINCIFEIFLYLGVLAKVMINHNQCKVLFTNTLSFDPQVHFLSHTSSCWYLAACLCSTWNSVLGNSTGGYILSLILDKQKIQNLSEMISLKEND